MERQGQPLRDQLSVAQEDLDEERAVCASLREEMKAVAQRADAAAGALSSAQETARLAKESGDRLQISVAALTEEKASLNAVLASVESARAADAERARAAQTAAAEAEERMQALASNAHESESASQGKERELRRAVADLQARLEEAVLTGTDERSRLQTRLQAAEVDAEEARRAVAAAEGERQRDASRAAVTLRATESERDTLARRLDAVRDTLAAERAQAAQKQLQAPVVTSDKPAVSSHRSDSRARDALALPIGPDDKQSLAGAHGAAAVAAATTEQAKRDREADRRVVDDLRAQHRAASLRAEAAIRLAEDKAEVAHRRSEVAEASRASMSGQLEAIRSQLREAMGQVESGKRQVAQLTTMLMRR
jgi:hypothetical protein